MLFSTNAHQIASHPIASRAAKRARPAALRHHSREQPHNLASLGELTTQVPVTEDADCPYPYCRQDAPGFPACDGEDDCLCLLPRKVWLDERRAAASASEP